MADKGINRSIRIFVNGKEVEHTLRNVTKEMLRVRREVEGATKGTEDYVKKSAEYRKVTKYLKEMREEISGIPTLLDKMKSSAGAFTTIVGGFLTFTTITNKFRQLIDLSAELADKQSDVRKTTGMTKDEVRALTQELDKLETRTSRADLLSIAEEGGRIGIAKEDIADFTEAMNKANVALGDTFGSASEVANVLGKLRFLYKETAEMGVSDAYNKIGSALNELGANGVASEQNIAAFATRVGALPNAFKPSIADAMALGAAFEESGVNAEVAGRSYSTLIQTAATNTKGFAAQMKMTQRQVIDLINSNPTEFFLQFAKSLQGMDENGVAMANTLKKLGIGADGVNKIIGAAANNNDRFRESISLANQAMAEGTSLTDEYNVKNENLAATTEKIQKTIVEWIDSDRVQNFVEGLVEWFGMLIGAVNKTDEELTGLQRTLFFAAKIFGVLIASMVSYQAAMRLSILLTNSKTKAVALSTLADKGAAAAQRLYTIAVMSGSAVINTFTGNVGRAAAAMRVLNTVTRMNPFGLIFGAITAVVSALYFLTRETKKAADEQKKFGEAVKDAQEKAIEGLGKTISKVDNLVAIIGDEKISLDTRKKAYEELIKINSIFNGLLDDEKFNIEKLNVVYRIYIKQLQELAEAKAVAELTSSTASGVVNSKFELSIIERRLAVERKLLEETERYTGEREAIYGKASGKILGYIDVETEAYRKQVRIVWELEVAQRNAKSTLGESMAMMKEAAAFRSNMIEGIDKEIAQAERNIEAYSKYSDVMAKSIVENNKRELASLKAQRAALLGGGDTDGFNYSNTSTLSDEDKKKQAAELERRRKIADELTKIERDKNRQLRDLELQNREERAKLMEEGFAKEAELLDIERQRKINRLNDEQEDLLVLQREYIRRANEESAKGNKSGAAGFRKQANELEDIIKEKSETAYFIQKTYENKLQTLKLDSLKKQFDEEQKAYERRLKNLETEQNNELKSVVDLESAKQVLRDQYGYSEEELSKLKDFEKAKSKITLEQQQKTYEIQSEQLQSQIDQLQSALSADDAMAGTIWGKMFDEEQREQILEWIEELQNQLSKIGKPGEESTSIDEENKKLGSFIDIFGFTADQWEAAFGNLDTMSGKLALVQMGVQAMTNAWSQFYSLQRTNMQRDLDAFTTAANRKKEALKKQLDEGYISETAYNAKIAKLDAELEKKRSEMEYRSAMSEWSMSLMQAATNTALGITAALAMNPPNFIIAAIVGGMGAIQAGLIAANKPKKPTGYFGGGESGGSGFYDGYGNELADGPLHANEYVIPEWLRRDPQIARMEEFIEARRTGVRPAGQTGYADGGETRAQTAVTANPIQSGESDLALVTAIHKLVDTLEEFPSKPIKAELSRTLQVAKNMKSDIEDYENHRNKNKR